MNDATDMRAVIVPKSDQLNADDLIAGPRTITVSRVAIRPGTEQPVSIHFEGDDGKPWKPCKSMARVMVHCWGPDASKYAGRSLTLYCDPKVKWGGMAVGGIRISHLSHIDRDMVMALTETKGSRKPFTVKPLMMAARDDSLIRDADTAAARGMAAYAAFFKSRTRDEQRALQPGHEARKAIATRADSSSFDEAVDLETGEVTDTATSTPSAAQPEKNGEGEAEIAPVKLPVPVRDLVTGEKDYAAWCDTLKARLSTAATPDALSEWQEINFDTLAVVETRHPARYHDLMAVVQARINDLLAG